MGSPPPETRIQAPCGPHWSAMMRKVSGFMYGMSRYEARIAEFV